uniref:Uncharacterized protein n=1 Tax=Glossina pallidipes TaxID=7398 RepID=A0A1B0AC37_GLOPL
METNDKNQANYQQQQQQQQHHRMNRSAAITETKRTEAQMMKGNGPKQITQAQTSASATVTVTTITTTAKANTDYNGDDEGVKAKVKQELNTNGTIGGKRSGGGAAVTAVEMLNTYKGASTLCTPSTPRIELSRASSSSHHEEDSRESSPENVFEQVGTGTLQESIDLGFREEGALELRSSTEELYFMDPQQKREEEAKLLQQQQQQQQQQMQQQPKRSSPHIFKFDDHQAYLQQHQRKDSASSEVAALLCISGRTSRVSSVGSQGSAVSHLSAVSGLSRSPSPHRMLLETSFCGPKPVESMVDGGLSTTTEPPTTYLLEQVLLARTRDPTQAVLAEGIKVESSPKRKPPTSLTNGDDKLTEKILAQNRPDSKIFHAKSSVGAQRRNIKSPGQMIVGKTPSGTEYIRINLKPDHMYDDKGVAPHEKIVEAPNTVAPVYSRGSTTQKKPASLCLTQKNLETENRLTPTASPKTLRGQIMGPKDLHGSRSPSPAAISVSRKSSFSSLFRLGGKDSPDSPRERSRSRSKSKDRQTPQSQAATPNKQKSVLAIFKTGKRGSSAGTEPARTSKSSSPIDGHELQNMQSRSKSQTPVITSTGSRPNSRLRYYDDPVEGFIHIPLRTPPEEKEVRKVFQNIQQLNAEPVKVIAAPITVSDLAAAAAALKPVGARKGSSGSGKFTIPPRPQQIRRIENLDAIHTLSQDDDGKDPTWSMEVNRHSSQDSQETIGSAESYASAIRVTGNRSQLAHVKEHTGQENGIAAEAEIHRLPSVESTTSAAEVRVVETKATINSSAMREESAAARERRKLLFATRLGSGSQEQVFTTQFSISKTESISSHMSEEQGQESLTESPTKIENLRRQGTVIRRPDEEEGVTSKVCESTESYSMKKAETKESIKSKDSGDFKEQLKSESSLERSITQRQKSLSTSEDEKSKAPAANMNVNTGNVMVLRRKISASDDQRRKSRSTSEDDNEVAITNNRHSRYLENFDVRRKYHENIPPNVPRKPRRQSSHQDIHPPEFQQETVKAIAHVIYNNEQCQRKPVLPQPPPPSTEPTPLPSPNLRDIIPSTSSPKSTMRSQSQSPVERSRQTPPKPPRTSTPTKHSQSESPTVAAAELPLITPKKLQKHDRQSMHSTDEPLESSESERDSDLGANAVGGSGSGAASLPMAVDVKRKHLSLNVGYIEDHESTGLVSQESFEDELPYIPTTLPEERAQGVPLIPMKERANMELKMCPVERPRSTTPLNPSHLEEYCGIVTANENVNFEMFGSVPVRGEKLRISLPRKEPNKEKAQSTKSPRRLANASGKSWFEFAEEGLRASGNLERKDSHKYLQQQQQKQLNQTKEEVRNTKTHSGPFSKTINIASKTTTIATTSTQRKLSGHWIDFENIPEKRKPPKRITTLPRDSVTGSATQTRSQTKSVSAQALVTAGQHQQSSQRLQSEFVAAVTSASHADGKLHYNYVKPEDCQCECHEGTRETSGTSGTTSTTGPRAGVDLLQQGDDMLPLLEPETQEGIEPSDSSRECSGYTDDELQFPTRQGSSGRSKSSSSKAEEFPRRDGSRSSRIKQQFMEK